MSVEPDGRSPVELRHDDLRLEDVRGRDHGHDEDEGADVADLLREDPLAAEPRTHRVVLSRNMTSRAENIKMSKLKYICANTYVPKR